MFISSDMCPWCIVVCIALGALLIIALGLWLLSLDQISKPEVIASLATINPRR